MDFDKEEILEQLVQFELNFYKHIAGTSKSVVIPIPSKDAGLTQADIEAYETDARSMCRTILYKVKCNNLIFVFSKTADRIGIFPDTDLGCFEC